MLGIGDGTRNSGRSLPRWLDAENSIAECLIHKLCGSVEDWGAYIGMHYSPEDGRVSMPQCNKSL